MRDEWKCAITMPGALFVTIHGTLTMDKLSVDNSAML